MISQALQESVITSATLVICILSVVTVLAVCVYAHRHWRRLRRWNTRMRREQQVHGAPRRRRSAWRTRSAV
jgi:predicted PurR-regulated permease PerM